MTTYRSRFRNITPNLRIVGVDDGAFPPNKKPGMKTLLVAVLFQSAKLKAVRLARIDVDGRNANQVLRKLLRGLDFDIIMLSGISLAGFNLVNIADLARTTHRPVIAIASEKPDNAAVKRALQTHFTDWKERWRIVRAAGRLHACKPLQEEPGLYFEVKGASPSYAKEVVTSNALISRLPEPVRVARILARGLSELSVSHEVK